MRNNLNISLYSSYHVKYLCISVVANRWSDDGAGFNAALLKMRNNLNINLYSSFHL